MATKVKLLKSLAQGRKVFPAGTVGEIVIPVRQASFKGQPIFDYYVKIEPYRPVGVFKSEVEIMEEA